MAHFRGTVQGGKGVASRLGTKNSGMKVTCNGWNVGVEVVAKVNEHGEDVIHIYQTGGSNGSSPKHLISEVKKE